MGKDKDNKEEDLSSLFGTMGDFTSSEGNQDSDTGKHVDPSKLNLGDNQYVDSITKDVSAQKEYSGATGDNEQSTQNLILEARKSLQSKSLDECVEVYHSIVRDHIRSQKSYTNNEKVNYFDQVFEHIADLVSPYFKISGSDVNRVQVRKSKKDESKYITKNIQSSLENKLIGGPIKFNDNDIATIAAIGGMLPDLIEKKRPMAYENLLLFKDIIKHGGTASLCLAFDQKKGFVMRKYVDQTREFNKKIEEYKEQIGREPDESARKTLKDKALDRVRSLRAGLHQEYLISGYIHSELGYIKDDGKTPNVLVRNKDADKNPGVMRVYDNLNDGSLVVEYIPGKTLLAWLEDLRKDVSQEEIARRKIQEGKSIPQIMEEFFKEGKIPSKGKIKNISLGLAKILEEIHAKQITHGDYKLGNVMISGDNLTVIDFGEAFLSYNSRKKKQPSFSQQISGSECFYAAKSGFYYITPKADVHSLNIMVYQLMTSVYDVLGIENTILHLEDIKNKDMKHLSYNEKVEMAQKYILKNGAIIPPGELNPDMPINASKFIKNNFKILPKDRLSSSEYHKGLKEVMNAQGYMDDFGAFKLYFQPEEMFMFPKLFEISQSQMKAYRKKFIKGDEIEIVSSGDLSAVKSDIDSDTKVKTVVK